MKKPKGFWYYFNEYIAPALISILCTILVNLLLAKLGWFQYLQTLVLSISTRP